ncbi:MAG: caspase family protein [Actinomycetota bacterium]|nr:caspase family protein [Actinomycetota bacterium]
MTELAMGHRPPRSRAAISVAVVLALLQLAWLVVPQLSGDRGQNEDVVTHVAAAALVDPEVAVAADPIRQEETLAAAGAVVAAADQPQVVPVRTPVNSPADFARLFAAQTNATQDPNDPATTRWAVLIGINQHQGPTRTNVGSRQDAEDLHRHLLGLGWRSDHIVLLTDLAATRPAIEQAIAWLASKTDGASTAVFHYSGHTKQWKDRNADSDPEVPDEGIWPADNRHMVDREFVDRFAAVNAGRLWVSLSTCEAAGFEDLGLRRPGRLLTFSAREPEKSYEDPSVANSVWGYFLFERGLIGRASDPDRNGDITVQEAFAYAAPPTTQRTANQRPYGPQHPVMIDDAGAFSLQIPPRVKPPTAGSDGEVPCVGNICLPPLPGGRLPD